MMGKQHLFFGITTGVATSFALGTMGLNIDTTEGFVFIGLTVLGSLLPDVDNPGTTLGKRVRPLSDFLYKTIGHRTYTHDLFLMIILCFVSLRYFNNYIGLYGLWLGIFGHLFLDSFTANGIPFFIIINKKNIHLLPYKLRIYSSSGAAKIITAICSVIYIYGGKYLLTFLK